jgi:catechol 2,3-dioxygenase-like lactoylglutathione lyase family enzyme
MITKFLHTGIEVEDLGKAIKLYEKFGFSVVKQFEKTEPRAKAAHISSSNGAVIELWQFLEKSHPQVEYIRRHIAVESSDLDADIEKLIEDGCKLVIPVTQGVTLKYAFVEDPDGNYIEVGQR